MGRLAHPGLVAYLKVKLAFNARFKGGVLDPAVLAFAKSQALSYCRDHPEWLPKNRAEVFAASIGEAISDTSAEEQVLINIGKHAEKMTRHDDAMLILSERAQVYEGTRPWQYRYWFPKRTVHVGVMPKSNSVERSETVFHSPLLRGAWASVSSPKFYIPAAIVTTAVGVSLAARAEVKVEPWVFRVSIN